jgi:hypothetical protein
MDQPSHDPEAERRAFRERAVPRAPRPRREDETGGGRPPSAWTVPPQYQHPETD